MSELETERNELTIKIRTFKSEITSLKEEYSSKMTMFTTLESERDQLLAQVREYSSKYEKLKSMEVEYKSFRSETEVKMSTFND